MRGASEILAFNRGVVSPRALSRIDLKRMAFSAEEQTNWMPRSMGSMMLRPGLGYRGDLLGYSIGIPFVFSASDTALIELSERLMRVWVGGELVTRPSVTSAISNGGFDTNLTGWTDQDESGGVSDWVTGGYMRLTGNGSAFAIREQAVSVTGGNVGVLHALRIVIDRGPVTLRIGSSSLGSEYRSDTTLGTGTHSITLTPTGTFYVQFRNRSTQEVRVDSVAIEAAGVLTIPAPYRAVDEFREVRLVRWQQSGDVVYLACEGRQQRKIERRADGSWSFVLYQPPDGPFRIENVGPTTIAASALSGAVTLTASASLFRDLHVGALFRITSVGQRVETDFTAENTFSDSIRVTSVGDARAFAVILTGTFTATVTLQRSVGIEGAWEDVTTYTAPVSTTYDDGLDNQFIFYRIGIKTGGYTSGTVESVLNYSVGSRTGVVRITAVASDLSATADVLSALGGTGATDIWAEGLWSGVRGWPSSVAIHDARLWWAGNDRFVGSISDGFESFDSEFEGDAGPISRTIGFGPVDSINWLISLARLLAGTDSLELSCKSTSFDEPLTPTNFTPKKVGTQGSAKVAAVEVDNKALFLQRCGRRVYELSYSIEKNDYSADADLTAICPDFLAPGVVRIAVQRQPDTRVHCVRSDGKVGVLVFDRAENILCWVLVETDGVIEDVVVLPGIEEDEVYYLVQRTINGSAVRHLEKWAMESECIGGALNKQADAFVSYSGANVTTLACAHLEGETVVIWADGEDRGTATVSGGSVALGGSYTNVVVGLSYVARFKSAKLAYVVEPGTSALGSRKMIDTLVLVLLNTHANGIEFGQDFTTMDALPMMERYEEVDPDTIWSEYEADPITVPGEWGNDVRLCLRATAPRPCTVSAAVITLTSNTR